MIISSECVCLRNFDNLMVEFEENADFFKDNNEDLHWIGTKEVKSDVIFYIQMY